jgi:hypothetical protein
MAPAASNRFLQALPAVFLHPGDILRVALAKQTVIWVYHIRRHFLPADYIARPLKKHVLALRSTGYTFT